MMITVIGGSDSGKSAFAEQVLCELATENRIYLATMEPEGETARAKIARHRNLRKGKGFKTVECARELEKVKGQFGPEDHLLLECMTNLCANELFGDWPGECAEIGRYQESVEQRICQSVKALKETCGDLVVVTGDLFRDGITYDDTTECYLQLLGRVNQHLAALSDAVVEVAAGIPVVWKGGLPDRF